MIDRRKKLYCGPKHKLIPTLEALANYVKAASDTANEIDGLNYGGHKKLITTLLSGATAEVDKLIMIDCKEVENAGKTLETADRK
jgi:hypothetical protein